MSMCLLYMLQELVPKEPIVSLVTVICIIVFAASFRQLNKTRKIFIGFLFGMVVIIHLLYGNVWMEVFDGITQNLALLSIILLSPLISIPLKKEGDH